MGGKIREVVSLEKAKPTLEGAGVRLKRAFGRVDERLDPFLLLDHFGSDNPQDYLPGFPMHPHRGIETITYMLSGQVDHGDSLGHKGRIGPGEVQWMTAGSGIVHEEMPRKSERLDGLQLWANLPKAHKMTDPKYRELKAEDMPWAELGPGARAKVLCGAVAGVGGPVDDIVTRPRYLDLHLDPEARVQIPVAGKRNAFAFGLQGQVFIGEKGDTLTPDQLAILGPGDACLMRAGEQGARLILCDAEPLGEPVAWGGPIVMNTQAELQRAFDEYRAGTFLKHKQG